MCLTARTFRLDFWPSSDVTHDREVTSDWGRRPPGSCCSATGTLRSFDRREQSPGTTTRPCSNLSADVPGRGVTSGTELEGSESGGWSSVAERVEQPAEYGDVFLKLNALHCVGGRVFDCRSRSLVYTQRSVRDTRLVLGDSEKAHLPRSVLFVDAVELCWADPLKRVVMIVVVVLVASIGVAYLWFASNYHSVTWPLHTPERMRMHGRDYERNLFPPGWAKFRNRIDSRRSTR